METTNTPPDSSIAKLFAIVSPAGRWRRRTESWRFTNPTTPETVTNQMRPLQSGNALWMGEPPVAALRSTSRTLRNPSPCSATTTRWPVKVGTTARSRWSR